ncbi:MAG: glycoside hydrolase family 6 protein [Mycobacterium sp.]|nr:glycoside hydrolase family 6 protein [Mycobacterium sp.]
MIHEGMPTAGRVWLRRGLCTVAGAVTALSLAVAPAAAAKPGPGHTLSPTTRFAQRKPDHAALQQVALLRSSGDHTDANRISAMINTPQADWLDGGTPHQVRQQVDQVVKQAAAKGTVPVLVMYNVPGRDCSQYSAGGAGSDAAYRAWVDGAVSGLGAAHAVVIVEPDGLANLPSDCASAYPGQDVNALTAARIADIAYAGEQIETSDPNSLVYLDAGHSAWHSAADMAKRLYEAGVGNLQGFFLDVSNYQYTANSSYYGTWLSDCLAYATPLNSSHTAVVPGDYGNCGDEYYNGGPATNWAGGPMNPYGVWTPNNSDLTLNTSGVDSRYALELGSVQPVVHFVVDTSRNGNGPNDMSAYAAAPYNQPPDVIHGLQAGNWCNPPGAVLGPRPEALPAPNTFPLLDAYLWVKTPGESDGQCNIAGGARAWDYSAYNPMNWDATQQQQNDPLWAMQDPAAGAWFDQQALQLVRNG